MTHRHAIEKRSEEMLVSLLGLVITSDTARLVEAFNVGDNDNYYPAVICYCISAAEEIVSTGVYRARCEIHCETYGAEDPTGSVLSNLVGIVRKQLQSNLEDWTSADQSFATVHKILLADSLPEEDGKVLRNEIGVDLIWSPTD